MDGGRLGDASDHDAAAPRHLTRRDFTRLSAVAGGLIWTTPKVSTIRFAQQIVGSHPTTTVEPTLPPPTTTATTTAPTTVSTSTSSTTTVTTTPGSTTPGSTTSTTIGNTGTTVPTSTIPSSSTTIGPSGNTTTTVCKPGFGFGDPNHCHSGPPGLQGSTVPNSNVSGNAASSGNGNGNGSGVLSFTGADTIDLAILGATAVILGRGLYAFGRRPRREDDEEETPTAD